MLVAIPEYKIYEVTVELILLKTLYIFLHFCFMFLTPIDRAQEEHMAKDHKNFPNLNLNSELELLGVKSSNMKTLTEIGLRVQEDEIALCRERLKIKLEDIRWKEEISIQV